MRKGKVFIGTSGWHYKHWRATFYPEDLKEKDQFNYYKDQLSSVEINNSFYRLPLPSTFELWQQQAPASFTYSVKAPRFFTQAKKLTMTQTDLDEFIARACVLEEKLAVLLFQLPPRWKINTERLAQFMSMLPKGLRVTVEFREPSWYHEDTYAVLRKYNCAFCIYELQGHHSPEIVTANFVYIRLHGPGNKYQGSYDDATLKSWAKKIAGWRGIGKDVYIYFDNDEAGYAAHNAIRLQELERKQDERKTRIKK